jgi:hypothetical protein
MDEKDQKLAIVALKVAGNIPSMLHLWSEALPTNYGDENRRGKYLRGPAYAPKE